MAEMEQKTQSTGRSVFVSTFFSLIARIFSFAQAMIVSYYFGATKSTDFLFFCVSITVLLPGLFTNINQSVIIPNAIRLRARKQGEESRQFVSFIYLIYIVTGAAICAIISLVPGPFMQLVSKFSAADIAENLMIVRLIVPTFFFLLTNSFLLDVFDSYRFFTFPMLLDIVKSIVTILFIVLLGKRTGVVSMAEGILIASLLQFLLLNFFLVKLLGFRLAFRKYPLEKELRKNIIYVVISQVASILSQYAAMYLISGLSEGVYTALSYSDRLYSIFVLVFAGQVSTVLGINIIEMYAKGQFEKLDRKYLKYVKVTMTVILPVCFIMAAQAPLVISVLFQRGSFSVENVRLTSIFFRYTILMVPFLLLDRLIVRLIIAKQIMRISFLWNVVSKLLTIAVTYLIIQYYDYTLYGLGLLLVQFVYVLLLNLFMVRPQFPYIRVGGSLLYVSASIALCAALCGAAYGFFPQNLSAGFFDKLLTISLYTAVVMGGYFLVGFLTFNREPILQLLHYGLQFFPSRFRPRLSQEEV